MVAFEVSERSTGTTEERWMAAFAQHDVPHLRLDLAWREVVVVSAHPDDDVLAVGDLLKALETAGASTRSVVATSGEQSHGGAGDVPPEALGRVRRSELERAYRQLGVDPRVTWLGIPDGEVPAHEGLVSVQLRRILTPGTLVLVPWRLDGHPDHDAVGRAAVDAASESGSSVLEFPIWAWHWADPDGDDIPWHRAQVWRCVDRAAKRQAIDCFDSQLHSMAGGADLPILPASVLERFHRPFEVVFTDSSALASSGHPTRIGHQ